MKKILFLILLNLVLVILQDYFLIEFFGASLNPLLILSLSFAFLILDLDGTALTSILVGGLIIDLFGVGIVGWGATILVLIILSSTIIKTYISKGLILQAVLIVIATMIYKHTLSFAVFYSGLLNILLVLSFVTVVKKFTKKFLSTTYRIKA